MADTGKPMSQPKNNQEASSPNNLRRCILINLYAMFREYPYASIELSYLHEACHGTVKDLNWNLVYLEKKGLVELDKSIDCPPYITCTVTLSVNGIDLIEDEAKFCQLFPEND